MKSLRDGLFDPCENLSFLFLGGNSLRSVSDDFLLTNRWIRTIDLSQNELQSVPDSLSKGKPLMKSEGSKTFFLFTINFYFFNKKISNLIRVYLQTNKIQTIPSKLIYNPSLRSIDLENNNLTRIENFSAWAQCIYVVS